MHSDEENMSLSTDTCLSQSETSPITCKVPKESSMTTLPKRLVVTVEVADDDIVDV